MVVNLYIKIQEKSAPYGVKNVWKSVKSFVWWHNQKSFLMFLDRDSAYVECKF